MRTFPKYRVQDRIVLQGFPTLTYLLGGRLRTNFIHGVPPDSSWEQAMVDLLWFLLGFWIGGSAGFLLFACVQASRDADQVADATPLPWVT
jgi:hypothetical protein